MQISKLELQVVSKDYVVYNSMRTSVFTLVGHESSLKHGSMARLAKQTLHNQND